MFVCAGTSLAYRPKFSLASLVYALFLRLSTCPSSMSSLAVFRLLRRSDPTSLEKSPPCLNDEAQVKITSLLQV